MVQKLGNEFQLSRWAKSRSLFLPNDFDLALEIISPCNMALPQDRKNMTWIGYLGQTVPSGNFIDGPICVNNHGDIVTRRARCGVSDSRPIHYEVNMWMRWTSRINLIDRVVYVGRNVSLWKSDDKIQNVLTASLKLTENVTV